MLKRATYQRILWLLLTTLMLFGCGAENQDPLRSDSNALSDRCPPEPENSKSGIQRTQNYASFEPYSRWQKELPPKSCAGSFASYIPDLPAGYGLPPSVRPPLMTEGHVYLKYVQIPENIDDEALELINFASKPQFEFEIAQLSSDQANKFKQWLKNNPKSHTIYNIEGRQFYGVGGGGWYVPGNRLTGGIGTILDNNVLIKFSMPKMYTDESVPFPVAQLFHEIAAKNGL
jgi:hypothetical protein